MPYFHVFMFPAASPDHLLRSQFPRSISLAKVSSLVLHLASTPQRKHQVQRGASFKLVVGRRLVVCPAKLSVSLLSPNAQYMREVCFLILHLLAAIDQTLLRRRDALLLLDALLYPRDLMPSQYSFVDIRGACGGWVGAGGWERVDDAVMKWRRISWWWWCICLFACDCVPCNRPRCQARSPCP